MNAPESEWPTGSEAEAEESDVQRTRRRGGRGIYLLPNLFTTAALLAGFYGIVLAADGEWSKSATAIIIATILDGFDGRVARLTKTTTAFGAEYDSMSDMVSFGVAPAYLIWSWSLSSLNPASWGDFGWMLAFSYTACCGLRLARFNVQVGTADKRFFQGLACPTAAAMVVSFVWFADVRHVSGEALTWLATPLTLIAAALMVSNFAYYSFKDLGTNRRVPFLVFPGVLLVLVMLAIDPPGMILFCSIAYAASGPLWALLSWWRKRQRRTAQ